MIALLYFILAALVSPFKSKSRLEAENAAPKISPLSAATPGPTEIAPTSALLRGFEFVMREDRKCANV
jgi:hypothetical protein